jgi:glycosyltransferase involved in cell wall biosynthesis
MSWNSFEKSNTGIVNLLFVAQSIDNYRKGNLYLKKVVEELSSAVNIRIHVVGEINNLENLENVAYYGFLSHDEIYNLLITMDYFLLPSIEDNMPNVMIEALCLGCKVICFNVGGMSEVIIHGKNGYLAKEVTHESLLEVIYDVLENQGTKIWDKKEMGNFYRNYFSAQRQVGVFKNVHNSVTYDLF